MNEDTNPAFVETSQNKNGFSIQIRKLWMLKAFPKMINAPYGTERITAIVLRGTLLVGIVLTSLLIANGLLVNNVQFIRILLGVFILTYLITAETLVYYNKFRIAAWMLIALYGSVAAVVLLLWSLNASIGILTVGFTVFLTGALLGSKRILPVTLGVFITLCAIQFLHSTQIIRPDLAPLSKESHYMDVISYITIIGIFSLVSWLSGKQTEYSICRALLAEDKIKAEKVNLIQKLEDQSTTLRQIQLQEMESLYRFAAIGQSTTATLHELSNQLSILSLDIDDLRLRHQRSEAVQNAKEGIENINLLVRQARKQLQDNREFVRFNAMPIIDTAIKELKPKFSAKSVVLHKSIPSRSSFHVFGDPSNLSHTVTILLNNAFDACVSMVDARINVAIIQSEKELEISIIDNGPGLAIKPNQLFVPHKSSKPNGLGIGLYITKQIIESQFEGKVYATSLPTGAKFTILLPRYKKE